MKNIYFTSVFLISIFTFSQDNSKYPSGYIPVKSLTELNGNWRYGSDLLKINTSAKSIQFNDGMKLYLDFNKLPAYNQFYIYGRIGNADGTPIIRSRVRLSPDRKKIHLDRIDGNTSNIYTKQ